MLTQEQNDLITRTGPGTLGGELFRRYWQPVALSEELPVGAAPKPVRLLSESLVLSRDDRARPALVGMRCPHRGADLSYGRIEGANLRCLYHGWLFDPSGRCIEQPSEPAGSNYKDRIRHPGYPYVERNGLILAYLGPAAPPDVPGFPFFRAKAEQVFVTKFHHACNYLQANEGNFDPQHLSFLHGIYHDVGVTGSLNQFVGEDVAPRIEVEETGYGLRIFAIRKSGPEPQYVRITHFVMPNGDSFANTVFSKPGNEKRADDIGFSFHWHVPIHDTHHWKYLIAYRYAGEVDPAYLRQALGVTPDYRSARNAGNRYRQDRAEMAGGTFAGLGRYFQEHDLWATESQGPIADRTLEHLGTTDRAIIQMRRQLLRACEDVRVGREPLFVERNAPRCALDDMAVIQKLLPKSVPVPGEWWKEDLVHVQ
jgi:phenylpropionate dioxygenase-like ring-hydroxylating dioxygenase large terminal subunit